QSIKGASCFMASHHIPRPPNAAPRSMVLGCSAFAVGLVLRVSFFTCNLMAQRWSCRGGLEFVLQGYLIYGTL
ncbi:hypothetical protein, partial [Vibrio sp. IB15]|uniref:hypothetical protein n=1 Tax=Vibrio sp. IB15 TaxID=2779368 RepID=UPI001E30E685